MRYTLFFLLIPLMMGCASSDKTVAGIQAHNYYGQWHDYDVHTTVTRDEQRCVRREITMHRQAGLAQGYKPLHIEALDLNCDDTLDRVQFRSNRDRQGYEQHPRFADLILFAFYQVTPIDDHRR